MNLASLITKFPDKTNLIQERKRLKPEVDVKKEDEGSQIFDSAEKVKQEKEVRGLSHHLKV